jgi:hypothetical protein
MNRRYWIAPVGNIGKLPSHQCVSELVGEHRIFAISEANYVRNSPKCGEQICFYASGLGVVADAEIAADPEKKNDSRIPNLAKYSFVFPLKRTRTYVEKPVVLDYHLRSQLKALGHTKSQHNKNVSWVWFVHNFHEICESDFGILTRRAVRPSVVAPPSR